MSHIGSDRFICWVIVVGCIAVIVKWRRDRQMLVIFTGFAIAFGWPAIPRTQAHVLIEILPVPMLLLIGRLLYDKAEAMSDK